MRRRPIAASVKPHWSVQRDGEGGFWREIEAEWSWKEIQARGELVVNGRMAVEHFLGGGVVAGGKVQVAHGVELVLC